MREMRPGGLASTGAGYPGMKNSLTPFGVTIVCVSWALLLGGCSRGAVASQETAPPAPAVSVANPIVRQLVDWDDFTGRFEAPQNVDVRARVGGYVQAVHFRDGQMVRKGQLLFTLDPRPAQAQYEFAQAQAALAKADFDRAEKLVSQNAISRQEYDSARAAMIQAQATERARALDVEFTRVTAPVTGMVSDRRVDPGNLVAGGSSAADVLTTIVATNPIYFTFDASEATLLKYERQARAGKPAPVRVRLQDETDYNWTGRLDFADNAVDAKSGAVRLRAQINNPNNFIRPGMFGRARVVGSGAYQALIVPDVAIANDGPRKVVYVVDRAGVVSAKPVDIGPLTGDLRVIRSGVQPDDLIIVDGIGRAAPGQKVAPTKVALQEAAPAPSTAPANISAPASWASPASTLPAGK